MIQIFNYENKKIRTIEEAGQVYFVGSDVAKALGYARPNEAITAHCKGTVKHSTPTAGGNQLMLCIPESDVYRLVVNSKLPQAEQFEKWIFDEVLPTIRKHGGYLTPEKVEEALLNPDTIIALATQLKEERAERIRLQAQQKADEPYTKFGLAIADTSAAIKIGDFAKLLANDGILTGEQKLFKWMREHQYLCSSATDRNRPKQAYINQGLFHMKEHIVTVRGVNMIKFTPLITGKGQQYFYEKLAAEKAG